MTSALGATYALAGRVAEALQLLTQAVEQAAAMQLRAEQERYVLGLSEAYLLAGRLAEALPLAARTLAYFRTHQERGQEAYALRLLGDMATHREPPEVAEADTSYRQALALAEERGMRPLQAHCHRSLGTLYAMVGQQEQARTALTTAIELYRAMDMTFWLPETEAALAQVEGR